LLLTLGLVAFAAARAEPGTAFTPVEATAEGEAAPAAEGEGEFAPQGAFGEYRVTETSHLQKQIDCDETRCTHLYYNRIDTPPALDDLFERRAGKILIDFSAYGLQLRDPELDAMRVYFREIAKRGGRVLVEPLSIGVRGETVTVPVAGDLLGVSYDLFTRLYNYFRYDDLAHYHVKALTNPTNGKLLMIYFVHRSYGDICETLYSRCDVLEYFDEETFDDSLSRALAEAAQKNVSVQVRFTHAGAALPRAELDLEHISTINASVRVYKWLIASGETETVEQREASERFLPLAAAVSLVKYSVQAYDLVSAVQMYWPARSMKAEVYYRRDGANDAIQSIVFSPRPAQ
jgi:hypothetical protein